MVTCVPKTMFRASVSPKYGERNTRQTEILAVRDNMLLPEVAVIGHIPPCLCTHCVQGLEMPLSSRAHSLSPPSSSLQRLPSTPPSPCALGTPKSRHSIPFCFALPDLGTNPGKWEMLPKALAKITNWLISTFSLLMLLLLISHLLLL